MCIGMQSEEETIKEEFCELTKYTFNTNFIQQFRRHDKKVVHWSQIKNWPETSLIVKLSSIYLVTSGQ